MDIFLVARPTGRLMSLAAEVQEALNTRFDLYGGTLPPLHLTLARIAANGAMEQARAIARVGEAVRKCPGFFIEASGYIRFGTPHFAIGVSVVGDEQLFKLRAELVNHLDDQLVVLPNDYWKPHITLVSATFGRVWTEEEWLSAYTVALDYPMQAACLIEELELWYPEYDPRVRVMAKFKPGLGLVELLE